MEEHDVLLRAYAKAQDRCSRLLAEQAAEIVRLRAAVIVRDTALSMVRGERSVLCVGQPDETSGPTRRLVEIAGGRFLHHQADDSAFEAGLRAADMVICQTGCLSHDAYWRVQDHCRRTGKPCVMVGIGGMPQESAEAVEGPDPPDRAHSIRIVRREG
jgi:hypothetical protein